MTMKAAVLVAKDGEATLEIQNVDKPAPGPDYLLVAIKSASVNRTDLRLKQEHFKPGAGPQIAGLEMAGEVVGMGENVTGFEIGDRVMSFTSHCYAEYTLTDYRNTMKVPASYDWKEAAATPVWFMTAHNAVKTTGRLADGETLLVHAATAGVGLTGLQVAKYLNVGKTIGTSISDEQLERAKDYGLDIGVNVTRDNFVDVVKACTADKGADVIMDMVGAGVLEGNIAAAALGGRIVSVGRMGGFTDSIDLNELALKRLELLGVTFRTRTIEQKQQVRDDMLADLGADMESGALKPVVDDSDFTLDAVLDAQAYMASNQHFGKILLSV